MRYFIDKAAGQPIYMQLYTHMRDDIVSGRYPHGTKIPSKRQTALDSDISVISVEHAYDLLEYEGYIEARERSGYFVTYSAAEYFAQPAESKARYEYSTVGQPDDDYAFPFSVMAKTMRRVIADRGEELLKASPNKGCPALVTAIKNYLARSRGLTVSEDMIVIGSGAEYLYSLIVQILGRDRIVALEDPCYEKIEKVYTANDIKCEHLKLGEDGILSRELKNSRADALHISPYRSFPSGISASVSKKKEYLRWAAARKGFIIEDDFESEFSVLTKPEETLFSMTSDENVILINTFSKTIAPALRVGYLILPGPLKEVYREKIGFYSCTVPLFEQYLIAYLLDNGDFERHINRVRRLRRLKLRN